MQQRWNVQTLNPNLSLCDRQFSLRSQHGCESPSESLAVIFRLSLSFYSYSWVGVFGLLFFISGILLSALKRVWSAVYNKFTTYVYTYVQYICQFYTQNAISDVRF
jgi:hypothetical protein